MRIGKYLTVEEVPAPERKTKVWKVLTNSGVQLGTIEWSPPWRQYVFATSEDAIYSDGCLQDIAAFLARRKYERRSGKIDGELERGEVDRG